MPGKTSNVYPAKKDHMSNQLQLWLHCSSSFSITPSPLLQLLQLLTPRPILNLLSFFSAFSFCLFFFFFPLHLGASVCVRIWSHLLPHLTSSSSSSSCPPQPGKPLTSQWPATHAGRRSVNVTGSPRAATARRGQRSAPTPRPGKGDHHLDTGRPVGSFPQREEQEEEEEDLLPPMWLLRLLVGLV